MAEAQTGRKPQKGVATKKSPAEPKVPVLDEELCIGCMACVHECGNVFRMNDSGKAETYDATGDTEAKIQAAIDICPVQAISWQQKTT